MTRVVGLSAAWVGCLLLALAGGWSVMWTLVYTLGLLLVGSWLWAHANVAGLEVSRRHRGARLHVGDTFAEEALLTSGSGPLHLWPRLWVEIHDRSTLPGHHLDRVVSLGPGGTRQWRMTSECQQRGKFLLGPVVLISGDPFGLFRVSRQGAGGESLLVYPRVVPLGQLGPVPGQLPGGALRSARVQFSTPNASTVREHQPSDPFNRIHWRTTARTGKLMVREFELDPSADIWLVLDLDREVHVGSRPDSTEEVSVTIAASLAKHFLDQGRSVGLISQTVTLPSDRGPRQLERLLEVLAVVRASGRLPLDALLPAEKARFVRSSTLVVITASTSELWVRPCQMLAARGVGTLAVLVEAATFAPAPPPLLLVSSLAAARIPVYLVKSGVPLAEALTAPQTGRVRAEGP